MPEPLVSIIINNYNYGRFLPDAINSALNQTYPCTEVVVVDDGSTDDSREIIATYAPRVVPVLKENGGQGSAYNAGFNVSRGGVIIFLDSDDVLFREAVSRIVEAWRPSLAKVQCRMQILDGEGRPQQGYVPPLSWPMPSGDLKEAVLDRFFYVHPPGTGNAYSRRFLQSVLPIPESGWRTGADVYLNGLDVFYGDVVSIGQPLAYYRIHGANDTVRDDISWLDRMARRVSWQVNVESCILRRASELNLKAPRDLALRWPPHGIMRLALRILAPERYPLPAEGLASLAVRATRAAWAYDGYTLTKQIILSVWYLTTPLLPDRLARVWATWGCYPPARPRLLRRQILRTMG